MGPMMPQDFGKLDSEELSVQTVPSLDLVYTEVRSCVSKGVDGIWSSSCAAMRRGVGRGWGEEGNVNQRL